MLYQKKSFHLVCKVKRKIRNFVRKKKKKHEICDNKIRIGGDGVDGCRGMFYGTLLQLWITLFRLV